MNCTCGTYPNPDCAAHGWPELRELDPADEDRIARAEAIAIVFLACLIGSIFLAAVGLGLNALSQLLDCAR